MKKLSVNPISEEIIEALEKIKNRGEKNQERRRAHAVLLNLTGKDTKEIASIFTVSERMVYNWINEWNKQGLESLKRIKGVGRKPLLDPEKYKNIICNHSAPNPTRNISITL